jgi:hypothetical protein
MRDHDRDGLLRPMHSHSATPRRAGGSGPIDNSTNRFPIGQLVRSRGLHRSALPGGLPTVAFAQIAGTDRIQSRPPSAPDPLVTHHDRRRSTCDVLH